MSKSQLKHELKSEIIKINTTIDKKILKGQPYLREARYHKILLARLSVLNQTSMISRSMRFVTTMMF